MTDISLAEILSVKYLGDWKWSPDGRQIAYLWDDGGRVDCWVVSSNGDSQPKKLTKSQSKVADFDWSSKGKLALIVDKDLWIASPKEDWFALSQATNLAKAASAISWHPDGNWVAFGGKDGLYLYSDLDGMLKRINLKGNVLPKSLQWSPNGELLIIGYLNSNKIPQFAICDPDGEILWQTAEELERLSDVKWISNNTVVYQLARDRVMEQGFHVLYLPMNKGARSDYSAIGVEGHINPHVKKILHAEHKDRQGPLRFNRVKPNLQGTLLLFSLENGGWLHHYIYDLETETLKQITFGDCEDFGHANDEAVWSPDGKFIAYASNKANAIERHIYIYDVEKQQSRCLVDLPMTNLKPSFSPRGDKLAFEHCDSKRNGDLWMIDFNKKDEPMQLTNSMPAGLADKMQTPVPVKYKGAQDWELDAFLFKPAEFDSSEQYPGIVWVHGGPIRQMRGSWHPSRSYAHFYAFNQYLANKGYVVLSINYRGGIGYGSRFRFGLYNKMGVDDVVDVVNGGKYLKNLPYINEDKVAVYGLSYGGYMTLHCLTQYPDEFCMGINIAGIWDFAQWERWIQKRHGGNGSMFSINFGGSPEESPALWAQGSPVTFKNQLAKPLINFHGTKDANVDFEQLDRIVEDCVKMGKIYEAYYYPGEVHTFAYRHTWEDALPKMEREFEKYLK